MPRDKCSVCGDKAVGMNYNGLTCVSCRTFFTRSATRLAFLKCPKTGNCPIDVATRKSCPRCRLDKCFSIGMKIRKQSLHSDNSSHSDASESEPATHQQLTQLQTTQVDNVLDCEIKSILTKLDDAMCFEGEATASTTLQQQQFYHNNRKRNYAIDLTSREREIIAELQSAMSIFVDETRLPEVRQTVDLKEILSWPRNYIRRVIKFCKSFNQQNYKSLKMDDQIAILKPFFFQLLTVRAAFMFDPKRFGYPVMEDESGQNAIFICLNTPELPIEKFGEVGNENYRFFVSLQVELENDTIMRDLIIAQLFYKPRPNLSCPEFIRQQYFLYSYVLKRYMEHRYKNLNHALKKFSSIWTLINKLDVMIEKSRIVFDQVNVCSFDQLLLELWGFEDLCSV